MHMEGKCDGPDSHSFNHAIVTLLRSGGKNLCSKVLSLLDKMEEIEKSDRSGTLLDSTVFETILQGFSTNGIDDQKAAKLILERMFLLSKTKNLCKPTSKCYNLVLKAECMDARRKTGEITAFGAHRLLFDWIKKYKSGEIDVLPDVVGFNTVISSWANAWHNSKISKAEEIFKIMGDLSSKDGLQYIKADTYTYSTMLSVYAKSNLKEATKKAETFVKNLERSGVKLDTYTCNGMLHVIARSSDPRKAVGARTLLNKMLNDDIADTSSFNTVLNACAHTRGNEEIKKQALELGLQTYRELTSSQRIIADDISFATATKLIHNLSQNIEQRREYFKRFFDDSCKQGILSRKVIKELKNAVPKEERLQLFGHDFDSSFKKDWTRNL